VSEWLRERSAGSGTCSGHRTNKEGTKCNTVEATWENVDTEETKKEEGGRGERKVTRGRHYVVS